MTPRSLITTAIPYVNAAPHLGHALELVQADTLARWRRARGFHVRAVTGTDDNALKNVHAAAAEGLDVAAFVDRGAAAYRALAVPLALSFDSFVRTSRDERHAAGVRRIWEACAASGDLYRSRYEGRYCGGCEQFLDEADLDADGTCPEHSTVPEWVSEENWFFRLSRYGDELRGRIESGALRVEPAGRRNEVLGLLAGGLRDVSVSRSVERARGWGIPVPGDPSQVVYVWWDALANYLTVDPEWWSRADERVHVIGKGILRFHALWWPAQLLSARLPLPTVVVVHDYLTVDGRKIGKSLGNAVDPQALVERYGTAALRWWLLRDVARIGDTDFTTDRLVGRHDDDLANGLGNVAARIARLEGAQVAATPLAFAADLPRRVDDALGVGDFRSATGALVDCVAALNRAVEDARPWTLVGAARADAVAPLAASLDVIEREIGPFLPGLARRPRFARLRF